MKETFFETTTTWLRQLNWNACYLVGLDHKLHSKCIILEKEGGPSKAALKSEMCFEHEWNSYV